MRELIVGLADMFGMLGLIGLLLWVIFMAWKSGAF